MNDETKDVVDAEFTEETGLAKKDTAIAQREHGQLAGPNDVKTMLAKADAQIEFRRGLVKLIATKINAQDVVIYGKAPRESIHFGKAACKQILAWIEADIINVKIAQTSYEGKDGPYIVFECSGDMIMPSGRKVNVIGSRATYDDFFGSVGGNAKPLNEVDIPSVRIAAITSMWNHALEDAGMKPTLDELVAGGMDLKKCSYVNFKDKPTAQGQEATENTTQKAGNGQTAATGASTTKADVISEAQAKRLFAIAKGYGFSVEEYRGALRIHFAVTKDTELPKNRYQAAETWFVENKKN